MASFFRCRGSICLVSSIIVRRHNHRSLLEWRDQVNQEQKEHITVLRSKGISFGRIAKELGLSINTVKSFCRRNQSGGIVVAQPVQEISDPILCRQCGKRLNQLPGHRPRKFCSEVCKRSWWAIHPEQSQKKAWHNADCNYCGKGFLYYGNRTRKYCSLICYREHRSKMGGGACV